MALTDGTGLSAADIMALTAKSDYERQMVMNEIDRIRSEK